MNIDKDGRSELHDAAIEGNAGKVRALIQPGALVNLYDSVVYGMGAL